MATDASGRTNSPKSGIDRLKDTGAVECQDYEKYPN